MDDDWLPCDRTASKRGHDLRLRSSRWLQRKWFGTVVINLSGGGRGQGTVNDSGLPFERNGCKRYGHGLAWVARDLFLGRGEGILLLIV